MDVSESAASAEFSPCTPSAPQPNDLSIQTSDPWLSCCQQGLSTHPAQAPCPDRHGTERTTARKRACHHRINEPVSHTESNTRRCTSKIWTSENSQHGKKLKKLDFADEASRRRHSGRATPFPSWSAGEAGSAATGGVREGGAHGRELELGGAGRSGVLGQSETEPRVAPRSARPSNEGACHRVAGLPGGSRAARRQATG